MSEKETFIKAFSDALFTECMENDDVAEAVIQTALKVQQVQIEAMGGEKSISGDLPGWEIEKGGKE